MPNFGTYHVNEERYREVLKRKLELKISAESSYGEIVKAMESQRMRQVSFDECELYDHFDCAKILSDHLKKNKNFSYQRSIVPLAPIPPKFRRRFNLRKILTMLFL